MPRRTPVRELKAEETAVPDSPRRRSSRIAAVVVTSTPTPAPGKVATRRSSASETVTQPARITRRLSLSQDGKEAESPMKSVGKSPTTLLKESNLKSTPAKLRARRGSKSIEDENSQPAVAEQPPKATDAPRRTTRRTSISSTLEQIQETESPKPQKRLTRRRSSATEPENEPDKEKTTNMETIAENAEESQETEKTNEETKERASVFSRRSLEKKNDEDTTQNADDEVFKVDDKLHGDNLAKVEEDTEKALEENAKENGDDAKNADEESDKATEEKETIKSDDARESLEKAKVHGDDTTKNVNVETDKIMEEEDTRKSINAGKSPVVEKTKRQSLVEAKDNLKKNDIDKEETPKPGEEKESNKDDDNTITVKDDDSIEANYQKLQQIVSKTAPEEINGKKPENGHSDDEDIENLDLNITVDQKEKLDTSGNSDKENSNNKMNISKIPEAKLQQLTEKVILNDEITPSSPITTVLRSQIDEMQVPSSPPGKRKSLTRSPLREKSASPAFSMTAEVISDDEAPEESPSKRRKSEINDEATKNLEDIESTKEKSTNDLDEKLPQEDAIKCATDHVENAQKSPQKTFSSKQSSDEDVEIDVVNESLINDEDVIDDTDPEEEVQADNTKKAKTPKKTEATPDVNQDATIVVDDDSQEFMKSGEAPKKNAETIDLNQQETIVVDDDSQESNNSGSTPMKDCTVLKENVEMTTKITPSKSNIDNSFQVDETESKIKILDITPITDSAIVIDGDTVEENDKMEESSGLNTSISKGIENIENDTEDEVIKNTEDVEVPQNDKKTPKKTHESLGTQEKVSADKEIEDNAAQTVQDVEETPNDFRKSMNTLQLTNSSKKNRKSLKSQNNTQHSQEETSMIVSEENTNSRKTPARNDVEDMEDEENDSKKTPQKSRKSLTVSKSSRKSLIPEYDDVKEKPSPKKSPKNIEDIEETKEVIESSQNQKKTPKKSRKSLSNPTESSKGKRKSLKSEDDLMDSEIDESEMAEINEFLGEVSVDDQTSEKKSMKGRESINDSAKKTKRRSQVEEEFKRYEKVDKSIDETTSAKKKKKPSMTIIETKDGDELDAQVGAYLKRKADELFSSSGEDSDDDDYKPESAFIDDMAEEVDEEETDVSVDSNEIIFEGESLNSSDTETEGDEEESEDDSFICDDENTELLSGSEDFLQESSPEKKASKESKKDGMQKFSRIVVNNDDSESDVTVEESKKEEESPTKKKGYSRIVPNEESDSEDQNLKIEASEDTTENTDPGEAEIVKEVTVSDEEEEIPLLIMSNEEAKKSPAKKPLEMRVIKVDDSDSEDEPVLSTVKLDTDDSKAGNSSIVDTTDQGRRKSVRKSSMSVQENISLQDIDDGDLSQRITKVVEWFYTGIKSNADMSGNIALNVSLDYSEKKNEDTTTSPGKRRKSAGAIEVKTSPGKKRKSTGTIEILPDNLITSPPKKRKSSISVVDITSPSPPKTSLKDKTKSPRGEKSIEFKEADIPGPSTSAIESANMEAVTDEEESEKGSSPESTLEITVDRKERVVTRKHRKLTQRHDFEETPFDGAGQLRSIMEFKQLKFEGLDDWNKSDIIVKPSTSEEPEKRKRKRSQKKKATILVKPSLTMGGDNEWQTECVDEAIPSVSMPRIKRKKGSDAGLSNMPSFHPKDFKNQVIHSMGRVPRMDTKILLRKRKV